MADTKDTMKTCFIITPIGGTSTPVRRKINGIIDEVIEPILNEFGYKILVSHRINDSGSVTNTIIKGVYESDLVIANLTGNNPNVMYEVALRHASAKPIIHITENISELPFDINDERTIPFTDDMAGAVQLRKDLKERIEAIDFKVPASNPITEALEKKNLVNVPTGTAMDLDETMFMIRDEMSQIKKDISVLKEETMLKDRNRNLWVHYLDDSVKSKELSEMEFKRMMRRKEIEEYAAKQREKKLKE